MPLRICVFVLAALHLAAATNPQMCELSVGETCYVELASGEKKPVTLLEYREKTEPYFESANNDFVDAVVSAEVEVDVGGVERTLIAGPFRLPVTVNGVAVLVACTKGWIGGIGADNLTKDVRLEAKDAGLPFYEPERFVYPIRDYRWRVMNYQHTWLALAVNQARHYYHCGEDMGMIPDLEAVVSMTEGTVTRAPGPEGDGASNGFIVEDETGLSIRYAHMNTPNIRQELQAGSPVNNGEKLGLTGNTWRGRPTRDPHLHVGIKTGDTYRNSFPIIVNAYLNSFPGSVLPVAGGWRHVWAGGTIELDGSLSVASPGRRITSYQWTFGDGSSAESAKVRRRYDRIGTYSEQLRVSDSEGVSDLDFVEVYVLDRENKKRPPYGIINYYPIRGIQPGAQVQFLIHYNNMKDVVIDFGDGTETPCRGTLRHRYPAPGTYVVTLKGEDNGSGPGTFKARVIVE